MTYPEPEPRVTCLAASEVGTVTLCPHSGALVVHLQCLSLRFDAAVFENLALLLGHAQARLDHHKRVAALFRDGEADAAEPARPCAAC